MFILQNELLALTLQSVQVIGSRRIAKFLWPLIKYCIRDWMYTSLNPLPSPDASLQTTSTNLDLHYVHACNTSHACLYIHSVSATSTSNLFSAWYFNLQVSVPLELDQIALPEVSPRVSSSLKLYKSPPTRNLVTLSQSLELLHPSCVFRVPAKLLRLQSQCTIYLMLSELACMMNDGQLNRRKVHCTCTCYNCCTTLPMVKQLGLLFLGIWVTWGAVSICIPFSSIVLLFIFVQLLWDGLIFCLHLKMTVDMYCLLEVTQVSWLYYNFCWCVYTMNAGIVGWAWASCNSFSGQYNFIMSWK